MPKGPQGQKRKAKAPSAPKSKKLPRKLPEDPIARGVAIMREATGEKPTPSKKR
jgi:hypothetical protein